MSQLLSVEILGQARLCGHLTLHRGHSLCADEMKASSHRNPSSLYGIWGWGFSLWEKLNVQEMRQCPRGVNARGDLASASERTKLRWRRFGGKRKVCQRTLRSKAVLANCVILGSVIGFTDRNMLVLVHRKLSERNQSSLPSLGGVCGKQVRDKVQVQYMLLCSYGQRDMAKAATCFPRDATLSGYHGRELVRTVGRLC